MDKIAWHEHYVLRDDVRQGTLRFQRLQQMLRGGAVLRDAQREGEILYERN